MLYHNQVDIIIPKTITLFLKIIAFLNLTTIL